MMSDQFIYILILWALVILLAIALSILVFWARKGNKGANLVAAMFSFIAPDPRFQRNHQLIQEAQASNKKKEENQNDPLN